MGQGISQPVTSLLVKKLCQIKIVLIASLIIAIGGNVTYMAAQKANSVVLIILGRALAGFGAGERIDEVFLVGGQLSFSAKKNPGSIQRAKGSDSLGSKSRKY